MILFITRYFLLPDRAVSGKGRTILELSRAGKEAVTEKAPAEERITAGML